ncbi:MAG: hypothetical protein CBE07_000770 [Pelagibacteraceae bacterium TMED247]|nr:hypothetical protein [Candidatus Pelagibacter sp.]RPG05772.1 MAG: hypothetical protein CBE07_000770 [Pelagibacteraceae bacterium TMED247]|tara:strand:- start:7937 stop:8479 length:543 start_codon:yes stop_codon:yes gene_type:complete
MKYLIFILFFFIYSCNSLSKSEKVYICGDHPCVNKKEIKEYFDNNISIEVYTITSKKQINENFDLVELNMLETELKKGNKILVSDQKKNLKKEINERKKLAKLKMKKIEKNREERDLIDNKETDIDKKEISTKKSKIKNKKPKQFTFIRICKNLVECDIDKIEKIVMDVGKQKDFPDIAN